MAYESWYICDVCGAREPNKRGSPENMDWVDIDIAPFDHWDFSGNDKGTYIDKSVCSMECARKAIQSWLDAGCPRQPPGEEQ